LIKRKLITLVLIGLLAFSFSSQAFATELSHKFIEQTTRQTVTGVTYTDITGANINSGNFTADKKYLLVFTAQIDGNIVSSDAQIKAIHGSTDFEGSELAFEPMQATNTKYTYFWYTVWTAVASEAIKLQFKHETAGQITGADQITMVAIKLSDDLTENTDWFFNENATDTTLRATYGTSGPASITFTPNGSDDWLVLATAQLDPTSITVPQKTRINAAGGVADVLVEWMQEGEDATADRMVHTLAKVYTPTAVSTTFKTDTESSSVSGNRLYNSVFALNLNKLKVHAFQATQGELSLDTTNAFATSTNIANTTITPTVTGDVWGLGFGIMDVAATGEPIKYRMQVNSSTTFSDDYTTNTGWTQTGITVTVDDVLFPDLVKYNAGIKTDRVEKSLGVTLSDSLWMAEFEWNFQAVTSAPTRYIFALTAGSGEPASSSQDTLSVLYTDNAGPKLWTLYIDGAGGENFSNTGKEATVATGNTYYLRFERTSTTNIKLSVFSDSSRTTHVTGSPFDFTIPSTITGLTNLQHAARNIAAEPAGRTLTCTLDNTNIWNGPHGDQPPTQTSDNYIQLDAWDITDELPFSTQTIVNIGTISHTLYLNATKATNARPAEDRLAMWVTMELSSIPNCDACNTTIQQNQGWIFALGYGRR